MPGVGVFVLENQTAEWKETWRDDYLKWICGFANAQGGRLEIGRSDSDAIVGLADAKKLLEELPNKIRATMGIVANVNLCRKAGFEYVTVEVDAHPNAISYRGKYYYRSGQIEAWGRGIAKMKNGCAADGLPAPEFDIKPTTFSVYFHIRNNEEVGQSVFPDSSIGDNIAVNPPQLQIMAIMRENPRVSSRTIAAEIGIASRNIEANISVLKKYGFVERVGSARDGRWVVVKRP